jgi:hypothetical protein
MKADEERALLQRHYADVFSVGSLAALVARELANQGATLQGVYSPYEPTLYRGQSPSFDTSCLIGDRSAGLYVALLEREFAMSVGVDGIHVAQGWTPDVAALAKAVRRWLEDRPLASVLSIEFPFIKLTDDGIGHERGTYLEDRWLRFVEFAKKRRTADDVFRWSELQAVIDVAARHPDLRRFVPYTSINRFSVASEAGPPDTSVPVICPLGGSRYRLAPYWGGESVAEGDAGTVVEALASYLRDNSIPPSRFAP